MPIVPSGRCHDCVTTFHTDKSYRVNVIDTRLLCPGSKSTSVNPFRSDGGSPADEGWLTYSCGI